MWKELFAGLVALILCATTAVAAEPASVHDFSMEGIDGEPRDLSQYKGKVLLIVNTASKCGFTRQYKGLQTLHEEYGDKGLVVMGFPANDFGKQEPGSDEEIAAFCEKKFGVSFPMFSKVVVKGDEKVPLFQYLTTQKTEPVGPGEIGWNFHKFLVGKDGKVIARYDSKTEPDDEALRQAIDTALGG